MSASVGGTLNKAESDNKAKSCAKNSKVWHYFLPRCLFTWQCILYQSQRGISWQFFCTEKKQKSFANASHLMRLLKFFCSSSFFKGQQQQLQGMVAHRKFSFWSDTSRLEFVKKEDEEKEVSRDFTGEKQFLLLSLISLSFSRSLLLLFFFTKNLERPLFTFHAGFMHLRRISQDASTAAGNWLY